MTIESIWPPATTKARVTISASSQLSEITVDNCEVVILKGTQADTVKDSYFENCDILFENMEVGMAVFKDCTAYKCRINCKE